MQDSARSDGRSALDLRPFDIQFGTLHRADGSARVSLGPLSLVASFSGPMEVRIRDERLDRATLEVHHRPLDGIAGISSKALENSLETALLPLLQLTSHPRSLVLLTLQALSSPPLPVLPKSIDPFDPPSDLPLPPRRKLSAVPTSEKALALTAASLAAMDASSVGMLGLAIGSTCAKLEDGQWMVDPDYDEERLAVAVFGVGWAFGASLGVKEGEESKREVVWLESDGDFDEDDIERAMELTLAASQELLQTVRSTIEVRMGVSAGVVEEDDSAMEI